MGNRHGLLWKQSNCTSNGTTSITCMQEIYTVVKNSEAEGGGWSHDVALQSKKNKEKRWGVGFFTWVSSFDPNGYDDLRSLHRRDLSEMRGNSELLLYLKGHSSSNTIRWGFFCFSFSQWVSLPVIISNDRVKKLSRTDKRRAKQG
jgi:hypothetical protein